MRTSIARFINDESGATAIEYALIAAGISVAVITAAATLDDAIEGIYDDLGKSLKIPAAG